MLFHGKKVYVNRPFIIRKTLGTEIITWNLQILLERMFYINTNEEVSGRV